MTRYIVRRILMTIPLLFGLSILVFALIQLAPGDPALFFLSSVAKGEVALDVEALRQDIRHELGLDRPIHIQYLAWLSNVMRGNLGYAFTFHAPVAELIGTRFLATLQLQTAALIVAVVVALPVGILSAIRQYSLLDHAATFMAFLGLSIPSFWLGLLLILLFSVQLGWLPTGGIGIGKSFLGRFPYFVLPTLVLAAGYLASYVRFMRSSMLEVLGTEYITTARAKGLPERLVLFRHALKNSLLPMVTVIGISLPLLLGGSIVVETIFAWPGIGRLAYEAVLRRDHPVIMAVTLLTSLAIILSNLLVDIAYVVVDPRISYQERE